MYRLWYLLFSCVYPLFSSFLIYLLIYLNTLILFSDSSISFKLFSIFVLFFLFRFYLMRLYSAFVLFYMFLFLSVNPILPLFLSRDCGGGGGTSLSLSVSFSVSPYLFFIILFLLLSLIKRCRWYDTKLHLMVKFPFKISGKCRVILYCHYFLIHSDRRLLYELVYHLWVK